MLAGVARGIADNFGIAEWIPRVFFVVTAFMGGFGVVLYAACWAFIRSEDETYSAAERFFAGKSTSRSWIGIGLIVVAGIIVLSNITFLAGEVVWAGAFLVVGLLLYMGYIPTGASQSEGPVESKEGVQQITPTETLETEVGTEPSGDSPAGGTPTPPPTPVATPPDLPPARPRESSILGRLTLGVMLLGLGVLAILGNIDGLAVDADPRHYLALAVTILGIGLLVGSIAGRARWLILLGVILVPTLMFSPVFEQDWNDVAFDQSFRPETFAQVDSSYDIEVGDMVIDLTSLPWDGEEVSIDASVAAGALEIRIPAGVGIVGTAQVDVGEVSESGRSSAGLGSAPLHWDETGEIGTVFLDAEVNIGTIDIRR